MTKHDYNSCIGKTYGMLKVLKLEKRKNVNYFYCFCECTNTKWIKAYCVVEGETLSCGCFREICLKLKCGKYQNKNERLYSIWREMKNRCYNKTRKDYKYYGAREIKICNEWLNDFNSFQKWALENGYSEKLTIDRINSSGNYDPSNCRWVDMKTQNNNKRNVKLITYNGMTKSLKDWADFYNIKYGTFKDRYRKFENISMCLEKRRNI